MIKHYLKLGVFVFLIIASNAQVDQALQQLQILELLDNLNCFRNDQKDVEDTSNSFNPLENLNLYKNPDLVKQFFENVNQGLYLGRTAPFNLATEPLRELVEFFDILFFNKDDWNLLFKTISYSIPRVNTSMMLWAISLLLSTVYKGFKQPPSSEVFPQLFTPKWIARKANGEDGGEDIDYDDPEYKMSYFRHDVGLNTFHLAWHVDLPFFWDAEKYGIIKARKGELFLYMHHNLVNRNKAERLANNLPEVSAIDLTQPTSPGDIPFTLNINFIEFPGRMNNTIIQDTHQAGILETSISRVREAINQGFFVDNSGMKISIRNENGSNLLGAAIESSTESPNQNYYGNIHNGIHRIIAAINNPNGTLDIPLGVQTHQETAVQDPIFFRIHQLIDDLDQAEKYKLKAYAKRDLQHSGIEIKSVNIVQHSLQRMFWPWPTTVPVLTTFFENFTYDISNAIKSCSKVNSGENNFAATVKRLNHHPFNYTITVFSRKSENSRGVVRIYMSSIIGFDGKPFTNDKLYWNMFEMDRFPITLTRGQNVIQRSSQHSSVTIPTRPGFKELLKEAHRSLSLNATFGPPYPNGVTRLCGYPNHLLLPKGTNEGMKFRMFVIITDTSTGDYDEKDYPSLPYCGSPRGPSFPDGRPMGFPFDRKVSFDGFSLPWITRESYKFLDVIVKHSGNKSES